jgi:single-strand DNA-binding protein
MAGFQQTQIVGNLTADVELKYTQSGVACASFSVAVNKEWTDRQTNEKHKKVTFFRVTAWRGLAEAVNSYLHKGSQVFVTGEIEASAFMGQDGQPRASLDLTARDIQFLGGRVEMAGAQDHEHEDAPF